MPDAILLKNKSATPVDASTFGVLVGFAGLEHGYFEMSYRMLSLMRLSVLAEFAYDLQQQNEKMNGSCIRFRN